MGAHVAAEVVYAARRIVAPGLGAGPHDAAGEAGRPACTKSEDGDRVKHEPTALYLVLVAVVRRSLVGPRRRVLREAFNGGIFGSLERSGETSRLHTNGEASNGRVGAPIGPDAARVP